nr:MAG TPA: hypothetical protein [Caudoviricetes sp.]
MYGKRIELLHWSQNTVNPSDFFYFVVHSIFL